VLDLEATNITLPRDLKREARAKAIRQGKNLSIVIREFLAEYVKDDPPEADESTPK
jgi:hypothetical protein